MTRSAPAPSLRASLALFGISSAAVGLLDILFHQFEPAHQPIQAWSDNIPHLPLLACLAGALLIVAGLALLAPRAAAAAAAAAALAVIYLVFAIFPAPRLITAPRILGHTPGLYIGLLVSVAQQLILAIAAALCWKHFRRANSSGRAHPGATTAARILFGLCSVDFGVAHFFNVPGVSAMIPHWLPLSPAFWAVLTGIAFVAAGLALIVNVLAALAASLLGWMLLAFTLLILLPNAFHHPHAHVPWGSSAYNLTATAAAWLLAHFLSNKQQHRLGNHTRQLAN